MSEATGFRTIIDRLEKRLYHSFDRSFCIPTVLSVMSEKSFQNYRFGQMHCRQQKREIEETNNIFKNHCKTKINPF